MKKSPEEVTVAEELLEPRIKATSAWNVVLFNDDVHTFDEVIDQLVRAIPCSSTDAERLAWEAHVRGKVSVYSGEFESCLFVQSVLREIELITEIQG